MLATNRSHATSRSRNIGGATHLTHLRSAHVGLVISHVVPMGTGVAWPNITSPHRGNSRIVRARQIAMYLAHVGGGLTLTATGHLFERDRRTIAYAAATIEDLRDDDRLLDTRLDVMTRAISLSLSRL